MFSKKPSFIVLIRLLSIWLLAFVLTVMISIYQRITGPTNPFRYTYQYNQKEYKSKLIRSSDNNADAKIELKCPEHSSGLLYFHRFNTDEPWQSTLMKEDKGSIFGFLPKQPAAGKIEYYIVLNPPDTQFRIPEKESIILRFKSPVPQIFLLPHVILMIISILVINKSFLDVLFGLPSAKVNFTVASISLLLGGLIFGPIVQKYAFGDWWTGWPFGGDWTDSKVGFMAIVLLIGNLIIWAKNQIISTRVIHTAIIISTLAMLVIYMIPHSFRGSNLDYKTGVVDTGKIDQH